MPKKWFTNIRTTQELSAHPNNLLVIIGAICTSWTVFFSSAGLMSTMFSIRNDLSLSAVTMEWMTTLYTAFGASFLAIGGQLSDVFGRFRILLIGVIFYLCACLILALSTGEVSIILGSIFRGLGGALILPASLAVIRVSTSVGEFAKYNNLWLLISFIGYAIAPFLSGVFTEFITWRLLFWVCLPILLCASVIIWKGRSLEHPIDSRRKVDFLGALLWCISLIILVLILSYGDSWGWGSLPLIIMYFVLGVTFTLFILRELVAPDPLILFKICLQPLFLLGFLCTFTAFFVSYSMLYFTSLYFQNPLASDSSTMISGLKLIPFMGICVLTMSKVSFLVKRFSTRSVTIFGLFLIIFGTIWIFFLPSNHSYMMLLYPLLLTGIGLGFTLPIAYQNALGVIKKENSGMASGVLVTGNLLGATVGIEIPTIFYTKIVATHTFAASFFAYQVTTLCATVITTIGFLSMLFFSKKK